MSSSHDADIPPLAENYIHSLPNELLRNIVEFVLDRKTDFVNQLWLDPDDGHKIALKLALVDRRFNDIATPYLYRCIGIDMQSSAIFPYVPKTAYLENTLWEKPALLAHVRALSVAVLDPVGWADLGTHFLLRRVLTWTASNLSYFRLIGDFIKYPKQAWDILHRVLGASTSLRHLHVYGTCWELPIDEIVAIIRGSAFRLKELTLYGRAKRPDSGPPLILSEEYRTASIQKLELYDFEQGTEDVASLLKWPKALTELTIGDYRPSESLDIQSLLLPHKDTLVRLDLGIIIKPDGFDFSSFTVLRELRMCYWPFTDSHRTSLTEDEARRLLAPQLRHIHWYFAGEIREYSPYIIVDQFDQTWLYDLGTYVAGQDTQLRSISVDYAPQIDFDPDFDPDLDLWSVPYPSEDLSLY